MLNTPAGPLFGIENTNRGCRLSDDYVPGKEIPRSTNVDGTGPGKGSPRCLGVFLCFATAMSLAESESPEWIPMQRSSPLSCRHSGRSSLWLCPFPLPGAVFIDGIRLPYIDQTMRPAGTQPDSLPLDPANYVVAPPEGAGMPDGYLVEPRAGSVLTADEVRRIVENGSHEPASLAPRFVFRWDHERGW